MREVNKKVKCIYRMEAKNAFAHFKHINERREKEKKRIAVKEVQWCIAYVSRASSNVFQRFTKKILLQREMKSIKFNV